MYDQYFKNDVSDKDPKIRNLNLTLSALNNKDNDIKDSCTGLSVKNKFFEAVAEAFNIKIDYHKKTSTEKLKFKVAKAIWKSYRNR